jgi:hypothetical protein
MTEIDVPSLDFSTDHLHAKNPIRCYRSDVLLAPADCDPCRIYECQTIMAHLNRWPVLTKLHIYNGLEYSSERLLIRLNN